MSVIQLKQVLQDKLKERNLKPTELERVADLSAGSVRRILHGSTPNPSIETVNAMANVFGCTIDELVGKKNQKLKAELLLPDDAPWNNSLMKVIFIHTDDYINENALSPTIKQTINFILETYNFCSKKKEKTFDKDFFEWYAFQKLNG